MAATPLGIDHVALACSDSKGTERFYGELLGLPIVASAEGVSEDWENRPWKVTCFALPSGAQLDFFRVEGFAPARQAGWRATVSHVALAVESRAALEKWRARLAEFGVAIAEEQDHGGGRHSLYVFDPNGHYLELTCRPER
jgi:catechol 2,3-dioxygenase-like lactoylglutathione lyase family enzyme